MRLRHLAVAAAVLAASPLQAQDITEARTGTKFPQKVDGMTLTGIGVRTRTMLKVKVYAIGLYVSDEALAGPLAAFRGKPGPELYQQLVWGDFPKQLTMKFTRDLTQEQIQGAFRDVLASVDKAKLAAFLAYFGEIKNGQEAVLRWAPGGTLESIILGQAKAPIADKDFTAAVFAIWLGGKPIQDDIKKDLVGLFK
ncbi:MAG TPA: chalcone isomerase family protein [Vicinamibacteria bacterium]